MSIGKSDLATNDAAAAAPPRAARKLHDLALGCERIGLLPLRAPIVSAIIAVILCIAAALGVARIKVDDSLSQLFRSDTAEYQQYEEVTRRFPSSEYDVLIVIEGKTLLARDSLEHLRDIVTDLQLIDGTRGLISIFSARQPPDKGQLPAALFPEELPQGAAYDQLIERVKTNEILRGKLLSEDGELTLVAVSYTHLTLPTNREV